MINSLGKLIEHHKEKHPDQDYFGDSCMGDGKGPIYQVCQICGEVIVDRRKEYPDIFKNEEEPNEND